jgi:hypothetical protein
VRSFEPNSKLVRSSDRKKSGEKTTAVVQNKPAVLQNKPAVVEH